MQTYRPQLTYKGSRTYIHGTTLYQEIMKGASETGVGTPDGKLRIDLHKQLHRLADFVYLAPGDATDTPIDAVAGFTLTIGEDTVKGWVVPAGDQVGDSVPYDEDKILARAEIIDQTISLTDAPAFDPIEITTCLAVKIHNTVSPPPEGQKWLLARVALSRPFMDEDNRDISLEVTRFVGGRFSETVIRSGGEKIGSFNFLLGEVG
ncbi:MAG: hypothetical protein JJ855_03605 [Rhodospirillales bacterium]|nr:hypothetical protein [Rhodospirillales bacterium]